MADGSLVRTLAVGIVALVIGLGVGGLGPRSEVRSLREQVEALKDKACEGSGVGAQVAQAFRQRPWQPEPDEAPPKIPPPRDVAEPVEPEPAGSGSQAPFGGDTDSQGIVGAEDPGEALSYARDAMALRQRQAWAALEEQARPNRDQMASIGSAIDDMNADLRLLAEDFVAQVQEGEPSRRDAMLFAAETLDVLLEADERLYGALDEDQRAALAEEALDPMSYVDPGLMDVFMELEGPRR